MAVAIPQGSVLRLLAEQSECDLKSAHGGALTVIEKVSGGKYDSTQVTQTELSRLVGTTPPNLPAFKRHGFTPELVCGPDSGWQKALLRLFWAMHINPSDPLSIFDGASLASIFNG